MTALKEMSNTTLQSRLLMLIREEVKQSRKFKELENLTGIPADRWSAVEHGRQRPTCEMIEAVCKQWPQYAYWLATGFVDSNYGHSVPFIEAWQHMRKNTPESYKYLKLAIEAVDKSNDYAEKLSTSKIYEKWMENKNNPSTLNIPVQNLGEQLAKFEQPDLKNLHEILFKMNVASSLRWAEITLENIEQILDKKDVKTILEIVARKIETMKVPEDQFPHELVKKFSDLTMQFSEKNNLK